ncbi:MAG TPA: DUF2922 domain-containing protein [Syntrophomonadaceae bacterium]|nr:DUF2922 domain-containing protein [Syntrophomonadaceae bacterium]
MSITRTLSLTFTTVSNKNQSISISNARPDLDNSQVNQAMTSLMASNVFASSGGNLTGKKAAQLVIREVQPFVVA